MYVQKWSVKVRIVITLLVAVAQDLLPRSTKRCISYQYASIVVIIKSITSNICLYEPIILLKHYVFCPSSYSK